MSDTPVVVLQGARQTGKSTLVQEVAADRGARVLTLDDAATRQAAEADPESFVGHADGLLVLDEIQRAPELVLAIKAAVDRKRMAGRFLLTGSADLIRVPGSEDSLAGRAETVRIYPLSQGEMARRPDDFVTALLRCDDLAGWTSAWARSDYIAALCKGGYPEALRRTGRRRASWLADYVDRLLRRDARDLSQADPSRLRRALDLLAADQSEELVIANLARGLSVSEGTARADAQRVSDLFLTASLPAWSRNLTRRRVNKPKACVVDSGLAARLNDLDEADLEDPLGANHLGGLVEGFVASELLRQSTWSSTRYRLSHYRESGGAEVDIVVSLPAGRVLGIEVKSTVAPRAEHARGLRALRDRLGEAFVAGVVLHLGENAWSYGEGIWALPLAALWEL